MTLQVMLEDGYMIVPRIDWYFICFIVTGIGALYFWYRHITKAVFEEYIECTIRRAMRAEMLL